MGRDIHVVLEKKTAASWEFFDPGFECFDERYIYRCECHMHDESSRMVYGAFRESFMREFYQNMDFGDEVALIDCSQEICRRLDMLLVGKLWK